MTSDELKEVIASFNTNKGEVDVVRISHPAITTMYLSPALATGTALTDENGATYQVTQANMELSDESGGGSLFNERNLTIQGVNDLIAAEEDKIITYQDQFEDDVPPNDRERVKVDVLSYIVNIDGTISTVAQGPFRYFDQNTSYSQQRNAATLQISTTPTNKSETGVIASVAKFPTIAGFL